MLETGRTRLGQRPLLAGNPVVDLAQQLDQAERIVCQQRLAGTEQGDRNVAIGIGPGEYVDQPEVPEGVARVRAEKTERLAAEHHSRRVTQGHLQRVVQLMR